MALIRLDQLQQFAAVKIGEDQGAIGGPVVIPSCAAITLNWALSDGKTGKNVLYGRYAGPFAGDVTQANAIRTALTDSADWAALAAFLASTGSLNYVTIRNVAIPDQAEIISASSASLGTSTGTALPDEVAVCVTWRTALTGPQNRGRSYIPNWASNSVGSGNVVAAAAVAALETWSNTGLLSAIASNGYTPVIGQKARQAYTGSTGTAHPARPANSVVITQGQVKDNHFDTQRRRGLR